MFFSAANGSPVKAKVSAEIAKLRAEYQLIKAEVESKLASLAMEAERAKQKKDFSVKLKKLKQALAGIGEAGKEAGGDMASSAKKLVAEIRQQLNQLN